MSAFIDAQRERFGVELLCETIGVSASAYYQRATGERSARSVEDAPRAHVGDEAGVDEALQLHT